jgi:Mrp family chromosome partitioning ATPase
MCAFFRKKPDSDLYATALTLATTDGQFYRTIHPDVVVHLRRMLTELTYTNSLPHCLSVLSALRGEGVSYTALALGLVIANDLARRVCVVDLNWWSPGLLAQIDPALVAASEVRRRFWQKPPVIAPTPFDKPGLADVIAGAVSIDEALIETDRPNLVLVAAGTVPVLQRPTIARSDALKQIITELADQFDHILLDVPAILTTSDAIALASLGDACCLVVRQGVTSTYHVQQSLDAVKHLPMLGVLLNRIKINTPNWVLKFIPQD